MILILYIIYIIIYYMYIHINMLCCVAVSNIVTLDKLEQEIIEKKYPIILIFLVKRSFVSFSSPNT